jgi:hypothetical protein
MDGNIKPVAGRIAEIVKAFVTERIGNYFTATELRTFVAGKTEGVAPGSSDRILRMLRQQNQINYSVINRRKSQYLALPLQKQ